MAPWSFSQDGCRSGTERGRNSEAWPQVHFAQPAVGLWARLPITRRPGRKSQGGQCQVLCVPQHRGGPPAPPSPGVMTLPGSWLSILRLRVGARAGREVRPGPWRRAGLDPCLLGCQCGCLLSLLSAAKGTLVPWQATCGHWTVPQARGVHGWFSLPRRVSWGNAQEGASWPPNPDLPGNPES